MDASFIAAIKNVYRSWLNKKLAIENSGMLTKIRKIDKLTEIIYLMQPKVRQHCCQVSLFKNSSPSEIPIEILTAHDEVESQNLQKLCYEIDQMYIEQDFGIEAEQQDLIIVGGNDEEEMVTLELKPENEDQKLP